MSHDFAKRRYGQASKSSRYKTTVPGWVWLFTGSVLGAFVMFLVYLAGITPAGDSKISDLFTRDSATPQTSAKTEKTKTETDETAASKKPTFTFYDTFKDNEVIVTDKPLKPTTTTNTVVPAAAVQYVLQVASFRKAEDADRVRAQLILLNMNAWVEKATTRNMETMHRVKVGPYTSKPKLDSARATLRAEGFDSLVQQQPTQR
jgi:cell division protein FtsN